MLITLLTDFGMADYFVGAMKGAILSVNPQALLFDITHEIPPQDIEAGAFTLLAAYNSFPTKTIHVAVVDPGVGSRRRPVLIAGGGHFFIGPDNGLFSYIYERESDCRVFQLTREEYFRQPLSTTFHGRDIFGPVAGALSLGVEPAALGTEITDYTRLAPLAPQRLANGNLAARILHIDRFGNCVTNLTPEHLNQELLTHGARLIVNEHEITSYRHYFAEDDEDAAATNSLFIIEGSAGFLEIALNRASAAQRLNAHPGQAILVKSDE